MNILDQVTARRPLVWCRPATVRELFVLRLAQKLGEPAAAAHYAELADAHSDETLLLAYRRASKHDQAHRDLGRSFHRELGAAREQPGHIQSDRLLAIKVERRSIAIAVFLGNALDFHDVRSLSSQAEKAEGSAIGFLNWVISNFAVESAALEQMIIANGSRRAALNQAIIRTLRGSAIPVWDVGRGDLLEAYGHPALASRNQLRQAVHTMLWSMFNTENPNVQELDAAAVGLYVQTERLFL